MGQIVLSDKVEDRLGNLAHILYEKEYFATMDFAIAYVRELQDTIYNIPNLIHHKTKNPKVGKYYVRHKPNKKTTYYITFDFKGDRYYIEDIINNHEKDYKKIMGLA